MNTDNNLQGEAHGSVIALLVVFDVLDFMTWLVRLENTIDMHISQSRAIGYFSFRVGLLYNTGLPNKRYSHNVNTPRRVSRESKLLRRRVLRCNVEPYPN